jgi:hypothetical protein
MARHVVVAHYNEDLEWLHEIHSHCPQAHIFVYTKADPQNIPDASTLPPMAQLIRLPNVGRESHTYIHHVLEHYETLPDFTFFTQADPFFHKRTISQLAQSYLMSKAQFFPPHPPNHLPGNWKCKLEGLRDSGGTIGDWWKFVFGTSYPVRRSIKTAWNGIFTVHKNRILSRPPAFYERLLQTISHHVNPEEGHYFERTWGDIFTDI